MGQCHGHGHDAASQQVDSEELAECPVMPGSMVVKSEAEEDGLVRDYNGQRYYLCCDSCGPLWDADPAQYATA
jgi:YHS domain-containing protein